MKLLLTGYTGILGRHLARAARRDGISVRAILHRRTVSRAESRDEVDDLIWGSLGRPDVLRAALDGVQAVVHAAWEFQAQSASRPTANETISQALFRASVAAGVERFAFISSVAVYGMQEQDPVLTEASPLASGKERTYIYPIEKTTVEEALATMDRKRTALGVFRPGPLFDESQSPIKKIVPVLGRKLALGIGHGRNPLPFIHAGDVADAVITWLRRGPDGLVANLTPTRNLRQDVWYRAWAARKGLHVTPVFIPVPVVKVGALAARTLRRALGRPPGKTGATDVEYAIKCATRHLVYRSDRAREQLGWSPSKTDSYVGDR